MEDNYQDFLDGIYNEDNINSLLPISYSSEEYPLYGVFQTHNLDIVKYALDLGAELNTKISSLSSYNSSVEYIVKQILDIYSQDNDLEYWLEIIKLLYEHGADLNIKSEKNQTPLDLISNNIFMSELINLLKSLGAKTSKELHNYQYFRDGILYGDIDKIKKYITKDNINLPLPGHPLRYPIYPAFGTIDPNIVKYFLDLNANPNLPCQVGLEKFNSTIEYMIREVEDIYSQVNNINKYLEIIKLLYEYGADLNIKSEKNQTPLDKIIDRPLMFELRNFLINLGARTSKELDEEKKLRNILD